jgi:type I restriction enzyme S subunit
MKWEKVELNDVLEKIIGGGTPSKTIADYWNGEIPWCSVKDMVGDKYQLYSTEDFITNTGLENSSSNLIPAGTVVTSTRMGLGRAFINKVDMAINQDLKALIPNKKIDNKFLLWMIVNKRDEIEGLGIGSTVKGIRLEVLRGLKFGLPPLPTQRKIASILSAYDDLIENNLKRIKLLEEKAFLRYKQIVREEKFTLKAFDEVANYINGFPFKPDDLKEHGIPVIKIKELKGGIQNDTPRNDGENIPAKYFIENKDILFAWSASIGAYLWCSGKALLNQHIFNVKSIDNDLHNWLYFSLLEKIPDFINLSNGATMQHIKKSALGMVYLPVPPKLVYNKFQNETEPILNLIVNLNNQNTKLREARDILLPRLMNGQIEV